MPVFGFNTDIKVGNVVFHIQTEDRGTHNPVLDTTIYARGRVLAKRDTSYQDFLTSPDFNEAELHAMLERQHKHFVEEVRAGRLPEVAQFLALPAALGASGMELQLLNPDSFLKGATFTLELQARRRQGGEPLAGVLIGVRLHTGTPRPFECSGETDSEGKLVLQFPKPPLGPAGAELQIQARSTDGQAELKYTIRPKPKTSP